MKEAALPNDNLEMCFFFAWLLDKSVIKLFAIIVLSYYLTYFIFRGSMAHQMALCSVHVEVRIVAE